MVGSSLPYSCKTDLQLVPVFSPVFHSQLLSLSLMWDWDFIKQLPWVLPWSLNFSLSSLVFWAVSFFSDFLVTRLTSACFLPRVCWKFKSTMAPSLLFFVIIIDAFGSYRFSSLPNSQYHRLPASASLSVRVLSHCRSLLWVPLGRARECLLSPALTIS